jgi:hypothetical protein
MIVPPRILTLYTEKEKSMTEKELYGRLRLIEYVKGEERWKREKTGEITVYDNFTTDVDYDGEFKAHVRRRVFEFEEEGEAEVIHGGSSIASGEDEMVVGTLGIGAMFAGLQSALTQYGSGTEDYLKSEKMDV